MTSWERSKRGISFRFLTCFRDLIQVPRIKNWVPRIRKNRALKIREIGCLQVHIRYLIFSLKKLFYYTFTRNLIYLMQRIVFEIQRSQFLDGKPYPHKLFSFLKFYAPFIQYVLKKKT